MNWLISAICSFVLSACMVYLAFEMKKEGRKVWQGVYIALAIINGVGGILDFIVREEYKKSSVILQIVCASIFVVLILLKIIIDYRIKKIDEKIKENEEKIKATEEEIKATEEEIAKLEEQRKALEKSEWGWESEFLKIEFINSELRGEFDKEVQKIKAQTEDLADAVSAVWHLIEHLDSDKIEVPDEDKLTQSIWDYLQEA